MQVRISSLPTMVPVKYKRPYFRSKLGVVIYNDSTQNSMKMFKLMRRRSESNIVNCYAYYQDGWYDLEIFKQLELVEAFL